MKQKSDKRKVSLWTIKKNESEWIRITDTFFIKFTPSWFGFVEKLLILGALKYLKDHGDNWFVTIVYGLSFVIFYFYLQSLLYNFPFYRFLPEAFIKNDRFAYIFSITVAGILLSIIYFVLDSVVAAFAIK